MFIFFVNYFIKLICKLLHDHYNTFFVYLEPIESAYHRELLQNNSNFANSRWDFKFLYPILMLVFGSFYCNVLLLFIDRKAENLDNQNFTLKFIVHSPKIMYHQIFPQEIWPQSDIAMILSTVFSIFMYGSFLSHPCTLQRYAILSSSQNSENKILVFAGKSKLVLNLF